MMIHLPKQTLTPNKCHQENVFPTPSFSVVIPPCRKSAKKGVGYFGQDIKNVLWLSCIYH